MKSSEMILVLDYLDAEFNNLRMTDIERTTRAKHWLSELGQYDYADVMQAVRKLSESGFAPRTGQVLAELKKRSPTGPKTDNAGSYFRILDGNDGNFYYEVGFGNAGSGKGKLLNGLLDPASLVQLRWQVEKTEPARLDYDDVLLAFDHGEDFQRVAENILRRLCGLPIKPEMEELPL